MSARHHHQPAWLHREVAAEKHADGGYVVGSKSGRADGGPVEIGQDDVSGKKIYATKSHEGDGYDSVKDEGDVAMKKAGQYNPEFDADAHSARAQSAQQSTLGNQKMLNEMMNQMGQEPDKGD